MTAAKSLSMSDDLLIDEQIAALASELAATSALQIIKAVAPDAKDPGLIDHSHLVVFHKNAISEIYEIDDEEALGEGSFGKVSKATHKALGCDRAIKAVAKKKVERSELESEIAIMKLMDHPNVVKLYEVFEDYVHIYLVMEICSGGELLERIVEEDCFSERQAAGVMQQVMGGLHYMHRRCICHRDIKAENFLLCVPGKRWCPVEQCIIKIIDFGVAKRFVAGQKMYTSVGTPFYVAPQVLHGEYTESCDLWSCGILTYILLCGYPPFWGDMNTELLPRIKAGDFTFPESEWSVVSDDAKDIVCRLICMDPNARLTAEQAINHTWIKNMAPKASDRPLQAGTLQNMKAFRGQNHLKKAALHVIAKRLKEDEIQQLQEMFKSLDADRDGTITMQELKDGIDKLHVAGLPENMKELMMEMDVDGSGSIDYTEFLAATLDQKQYQQEKVCWAAFTVFDSDGSGNICRAELEQVLASGQLEEVMGSQAVERVMKECDADNDGLIDFDEFMKMMRG